MAWFYAARAFGQERLPDWRGMSANFYRDAFFIGLGGSATLLGLERVLVAASAHWPTVHRSLPASFGQEFDAFLPAASLTGGTLEHSLLMTGIVVAVAAFVPAQVRHTGLRILLLLLGALSVAPGNWGSPADLAKQFLARLILLSVLVVGVRYVMRFNILGCFLVVAGTSLFGGAAELLSQPDSFIARMAMLFCWRWFCSSPGPLSPGVWAVRRTLARVPLQASQRSTKASKRSKEPGIRCIPETKSTGWPLLLMGSGAHPRA